MCFDKHLPIAFLPSATVQIVTGLDLIARSISSLSLDLTVCIKSPVEIVLTMTVC